MTSTPKTSRENTSRRAAAKSRAFVTTATSGLASIRRARSRLLVVSSWSTTASGTLRSASLR